MPIMMKPGPAGAARTAMVAGNYRPSLAAARELRKMGYRVLLAAEPGSTGAEASRFVDEVWMLPEAALGETALRAAVTQRLADDPSITVVVPMTEQMLNRFDAIREAVETRVLLAAPQRNVLRVCHDKYTWLCFSRDAGIATPPFDTADSLADLHRAVTAVGCPVVIRPVEAGKRIGKRKAITIRDPAELARAFPAWPEGLAALLVQRRFEGARYNVYFGAKDGVVVRELHSRSLRTDRWDGSGQTIEGRVVEPVAVHSAMLARAAAALGYTGIGCAQYLLDPVTGESCFLEINPRFGASHRFVERAGFELTRLAVELADREATPRPLDHPVKPVRFVWSYGDFSGLVFSLRKGDVTPWEALRWAGSAVAAALFSDVHVTWSWSDPLPTLRFYARHMFGFGAGKRSATPAGAAMESTGAPGTHG